MTDCHDQYAAVCKDEFDGLHTKLDRMDEAIRGNGKPGIQVRLDRLEQDAKRQSKLIWLMLGGLVTLLATAIALKVQG
jgi:hypothetical protein